MKNGKQLIEAEMKRRTDLVEDVQFRKQASEYAKSKGITPKEWNENKIAILLYIANEFCKMEDEIK